MQNHNISVYIHTLLTRIIQNTVVNSRIAIHQGTIIFANELQSFLILYILLNGRSKDANESGGFRVNLSTDYKRVPQQIEI